MKFLVTGVAGFIGMNVCQRLLDAGHDAVRLDNLNNYYISELKQNRLDQLLPYANFRYV